MNTLTLDDLHYTYDDYAKWKGDWELIAGVPVAMSPVPSVEHQALASEIIRQLGNQLEERFTCRVLGGVDYKVEEETVVRPDVLVVCKPVSGAYVAQTPELIIEVVSPSSIRKDERINLCSMSRRRCLIVCWYTPMTAVPKSIVSEQIVIPKWGMCPWKLSHLMICPVL